MKTKPIIILAALMLAVFGGLAQGATLIIGDSYNVTGSGSGFALGSGVNSGINPPTTRLTGSAAAGLRYFKAYGVKADSAHTITSNRLNVARVSTDSSTLALSGGSGAFDFGPALGTLAATPAQPAVYEVTINIANAATGSQKCSFAVSSTPGTAGSWDFGIQLYRATTNDTAYTLQKRVSTGAGGLTAALALPIGTVGTYPNEVAFLLRFTDAGAESTTYSSRVQVSVDGGATWIYDTAADTDLPSGWHFPGANRNIYWDIAGGAGPVTFDNFSVNWISGPTVATRTWTGAAADANWSSAGNWGGVVPGAGDSLIFNGSARQANNNDLTGLSVPLVQFNNGGFTLSGNALMVAGAVTNVAGLNTFALNMDWSASAPKTWSIANGSELVLSNTTTVEVGGDHHVYGGGTLRVKGTVNIGATTTANPAFIVDDGLFVVDRGTFNSRGGHRIGTQAAAAVSETLITNGATVYLTAAGGNVRIGDVASASTRRLMIDNSTLAMTGGYIALPYAANATGEVHQVGGTVSGCKLNFSEAGAGLGSYWVKNGVLEAIQIKKTTSGGVAEMYFDNAVLRSSTSASNTAFMAGLNLAQIDAGGLTIDAAGTDMTIDQVLSGSGGLTKSGYFIATLTANNTYTGTTLVQQGKLFQSTARSNATSTVQVADYAEFGVLTKSAGKTFGAGTLTLGNGGISYLSFDFGVLSTPTAPLIKVSNLSANGSVTINVANGVALTTGQIVLVDYDGSIGGNGFGAFSIGSLPPGVTATLVNNTQNSSIDLNITGVPGYRWTGAVNGVWDYSTMNWINQQTGLQSVYADGVAAEFIDGAATGNVSLPSYANPSLMIVSNETLPYVVSGGGVLSTPKIKKSGSGSLTRIPGLSEDTITEIELNAGSFIYSNGYDCNFTTLITEPGVGTGKFVKQGASTLTMVATNANYDGAFEIQAGVFKMGNTSALGTDRGGVTIANGATLDINDHSPGAEPITVSGAGVNGQGAIIDSTTAGAVETSFRDITMVGDTTFGSPNGGRWDIRARASTGPGPGLRGNGYNLTKVGSGPVSIACQRNIGTNTPYWEMNLGDVLISQGTLTFAESLTPGNPSKKITVAAGATLGFYDLGLTNPILRNIYMTDARMTAGGSPSDTNVVNGSLQITGANSLYCDESKLIINGAITGSGSLYFSAKDPGALILNGVNTYSGDTIITNGTLAGSGRFAGNVSVLAGTNAPGWDGVGTMTVNGNLTVGGMIRMELNRNLTPNSDRLVVGGSFSGTGPLQVVLAAGAPAPQAGDVYQLFSKPNSSAFASISLPDLSGLPGDRAWDTSRLAVDGTIKVTGTANPPNIGPIQISGNNFIFSGTGGVEGSSYVVLSSTNVSAPTVSWIPVATNVFGPGGTFSFTNSINPAMPATFFQLLLR